MKLLNTLRSFAGLSDADNHSETDTVIETIVVQAVPTIRAVNGYRQKLRDAVDTSLAHARQLVDSLGEPVRIEPQLVSRDPLVGAFFTSTEEASRILGKVPAMAECFFLMVMVRRERKILGSARKGGMTQRGIVQMSETFTDHEILAASPSLEYTRRKLSHLIVQDLARKAAEDIVKAHKERAELDYLRDVLKARLHTLELDSADLLPLSDRKAKADHAMDSIRQELHGVEQDILGISPSLDSFDDYLEHVRQILTTPRDSLTLKHVYMRLNEFGIKVDKYPDEPGSTVSFIEMEGRMGRRAVLLACMRS